MENKNEYAGYSLFNDIEDKELRIRNRAVVIANMYEAHTKNDKITPKGAALLLSYFNQIPNEEKREVHNKFELIMKERGYVKE